MSSEACLIFGTPFSGGESEGLPNLRAWGGCEAEPPGFTLVIILFRAGIETHREEYSSGRLSSDLEAIQEVTGENFLYGITAVTGVECGLSTPDEFTAVTA